MASILMSPKNNKLGTVVYDGYIYTLLGRGDARCHAFCIGDKQCLNPAAIKIQDGSGELLNTLCYECYNDTREPGEPDIDEMREDWKP